MNLPARPAGEQAVQRHAAVAEPAPRHGASEHLRVQRTLDDALRPDLAPDVVQATAARGLGESGGALPHVGAIQRSFGRHDVSGIEAHVGGAATDAAAGLGAMAYATGNHVAFASSPDLFTAAHEAAHVVQQRSGVALRGVLDDGAGDPYEHHADEVARAVVAGESAEALLDRHAGVAPGPGPGGAVQRALVPQPAGHSLDDRDAGGNQQFTAIGGGNWQDQHGYRYTYTAGEEFLITHGPHGAYPAHRYWDVEHQRELTKHNQAAGNGAALHVYVPQGGNINNWQHRYYYSPGHRYVQVPTNRVRWIDANGRWVDNHDRVLAPDGQGVDKAYAVTKEARNFIVPFKQLNGGYNEGLPGLFGGNVDPGEDGDAAVTRETGEESGNGVVLNAVGAQIAQHQAAHGNDRNRYTISRADVTTQAPNAAPHEMEGTFQVTASQFVGHTANANATKTRLLALFQAHCAADPNLALHAAHVVGLGAAELNAWMTSHGMDAMAAAIQQDVASYTQGQTLARTGQALGMAPEPDEQAGFDLYDAGVADARAGLGVQQAGEPAYTTGHADYLLGMADAQAGANNHVHAGYTTGRTDYTAGLTSAQQGGGPLARLAHTTARNEYTQGWQAARDHAIAAPSVNLACTTGFQEYQQGLAHAGANQAPANANVAYMEGYQDFI